MGFKTYLINRLDSRKFRLNGILPSTRLPNKRKLCQAFRDHILYSPAQLPHKVDLRDDMTPVEDQSKIGSCAANCLAGAYEYLMKKNDGRNTDVSRLFIYYNSRARNNKSKYLTDSGCSMTSAIEALEEFGTCLESIWPYDISKVNSRPSDRAFHEAKNHTITEALQVQIDLNEMKSCLAQGFPFAFGLHLFKSFDKASMGGAVPIPNASDRMRSSHGSHALLAVGYSDHSKSFIVRNSWGPNWGDQGYCYIPYDYMTNPDLCFDAWAVRQLANDSFGKQHWDQADSINYLKAAALSLMSMNQNSYGNNNNDNDNCTIEEFDEDDGASGSGSNQWPIDSERQRYDNNSTGNSWYQQPNASNTYSPYDASSGYAQQQNYGRGTDYYNPQSQWPNASYSQPGTNYPPNNNFPSNFQNQYQGDFQGTAPSYGNYPSNFPTQDVYQTQQNSSYQPSLADIMNASENGNSQYGMGFDYNNTPYNYPNQNRQWQ